MAVTCVEIPYRNGELNDTILNISSIKFEDDISVCK
jgi:hypothetical protein